MVVMCLKYGLYVVIVWLLYGQTVIVFLLFRMYFRAAYGIISQSKVSSLIGNCDMSFFTKHGMMQTTESDPYLADAGRDAINRSDTLLSLLSEMCRDLTLCDFAANNPHPFSLVDNEAESLTFGSRDLRHSSRYGFQTRGSNYMHYFDMFTQKPAIRGNLAGNDSSFNVCNAFEHNFIHGACLDIAPCGYTQKSLDHRVDSRCVNRVAYLIDNGGSEFLIDDQLNFAAGYRKTLDRVFESDFGTPLDNTDIEHELDLDV